MGKGSGDDQGDPFKFQEFNPYTMDEASIATTVWKQEFIVKQNLTQEEAASEFLNTTRRLLNLQRNGGNYKPVDPRKVVNGPSNVWAKEAKFNIDLVDNYDARVFIRDNDISKENLEKLTVNTTMYSRPVLSWEARLSQLNFKVNKNNSFYFSFGNIYSGETIISTEKRKMLISDHFSEIGFVLPT